MKVTRKQLGRIIKEAIDVLNAETGEVLVFDDDLYDGEGASKPDAPEAAAMDMMKRLGVMDDAKFETGAFPEFGDTPTYSLPNDKWQMMEDELYGKRAARKSKADKERLNIDNLLDRAQKWAVEAGRDYLADNKEFPETNLEDIAWDMSDAAELEFKEDEWNEMLYHFDFNEDDLRMYIADMIASPQGVNESVIVEGTRERLGIVGDTIYVTRGMYGPSFEDEDENYIPSGEMIADLMDSGDDDFFVTPQGVDMKSLNRLIDKWEAGDAGPLTSWDTDVFTDYYNVDMDRVVRLWARRNNMQIKEVDSSMNEAKKPPTDATIRPHMGGYSVMDDPYDVAEELGKLYGWTPKQIERAERVIRRKYIK